MNKKYLKEVLSVQSHSHQTFRMFAYLVRQLKGMKDVTFYIDNGNIYATKGKASYYPCIVAHTDTVHKIIKDFRVIECNGNYMAIDGKTIEQTEWISRYYRLVWFVLLIC